MSLTQCFLAFITDKNLSCTCFCHFGSKALSKSGPCVQYVSDPESYAQRKSLDTAQTQSLPPVFGLSSGPGPFLHEVLLSSTHVLLPSRCFSERFLSQQLLILSQWCRINSKRVPLSHCLCHLKYSFLSVFYCCLCLQKQ